MAELMRLAALLFCVVSCVAETSTGVTHSGGGPTAAVASMCAQRALEGVLAANFPTPKDMILSTVSGGTIGYTLHVNAPNLSYPVASDSPAQLTAATYELLSQRNTSPEEPVWFASFLKDIPNTLKDALAVAKHGSTDGGDWWSDLLFAVGLQYGLDAEAFAAGPHRFLPNFGLLDKGICPTKRSPSGGIPDAANSLIPVTYDFVQQQILSPTNLTLTHPTSRLDAVAFSSAFWAALVAQSGELYPVLQHLLVERTTGAGTQVVGLDGGTLDTTGITALLRLGVPRIVTFYNNNNELSKLASPFAFMFGNQTDLVNEMNSLQGPELAQVFPNDLYAEVIANLTNPSILAATLTNVPVLANPYMNISAYTLESLLIISNENSPDFMASLTDPAIAANLSPNWPSHIAVGMSTLDANTMCAYNAWKVWRHQDRILEMFKDSGV